MSDTLPIQLIVADHYSVSLVDLRGRNRTARVAWPRQVAMYLARKTGMTFREIGNRFDRDHGTVMHAVRQVKDLMDAYPSVRNEIAAVELKVKHHFPDTGKMISEPSCLEKLAQQQGVSVVKDLDEISGLWPVDDDPDELRHYMMQL